MPRRGLGRLALFLLFGALACDGCSASPLTVTAVPSSWPVPLVGSARAMLPFDGGLLLVEQEQSPLGPTRISRVSADGGLPSLVALNQESRFDAPIIAGDDVFWVAGQPQQIRASKTRGGVPARVLVTESSLIQSLAADATHVYYLRSERVSRTPEAWTFAAVRVPRAGGPSEVVSPRVCAASCVGPVAVADGKLYVATEDSLVAISLADRTSVALVRGLRRPLARVDGDDVYVLDRPSSDAAPDAALRVVPRAGGALRTLVSGLRDPLTIDGPYLGFAVTPTHVVLLDRFHQPRSQVVLVRRADGHVERRDLQQRGQPDRVAADAAWIYLAVGGSVLRERLAP